MKSGEHRFVSGTRKGLCLLFLSVLAMTLWNCNDHRFTPQAKIDVYPLKIDYETQKKEKLTEHIVVSNTGVTANLDIFELAYLDSEGQLIEQRPCQSDQQCMAGQICAVDEGKCILPIRDQADIFRTLKTSRESDGSPITYNNFPAGITTDISCLEDLDCHCDPDPVEPDKCNREMDDGTIKRERLGEKFICADDPLYRTDIVSGKSCTAFYEYYNRQGETKLAEWGDKTQQGCSENADCAVLGAKYICLEDERVCGTDIKINFGLEFALEQMVNVDSSVIVNPDKAAVWTGVEGETVCILKDNQPVADSKLYGLNRCDQMALKREMAKTFDGDSSTFFTLSYSSRANYRIMVSPVDAGVAKFASFCDYATEITELNVILNDPVAEEEACFDESGNPRKEMFSIDPENLDAILMDQLPLRVLYGPDSDYPTASVLTGKNFSLAVEHSAQGGAGSHDRKVSLNLPGNLGGPPIPKIEIPDDEKDPEPLDQIHLDARKSESPFGEERKPFMYYWEWAPNGKPAYAQDAVLIDPRYSTKDNPISIMGQWTDQGFPKIYFPIAGVYRIRVKVKDSAGVVSGPNSDCPTCPEWDQIDVKVKPSEKLHIEMYWNKGNLVDLDLFLVRYRDMGTFGVASAFGDWLEPARLPTRKSCNDSSECDMECVGGFCDFSCTTDQACKDAYYGWYCNGDTGQCDVHKELEITYIRCESDTDCGGEGFCNPASVGTSGVQMICSQHDANGVNDTCFFNNTDPRWGAYTPPQMSCQIDDDCNGGSDTIFSCVDTVCDFTCSNSTECLTKSDQFVCVAGNCSSNDVEDDPELDIDDVDGWGPENISLDKPQSGRYRVVARLYTDPETIITDTPSKVVEAVAQIYINGEPTMPLGIGHDLVKPSTYWKIADIYWDETIQAVSGKYKAGEEVEDTEGDGFVDAICAGWTLAPCTTSAECTEWYNPDNTKIPYNGSITADPGNEESFECRKREWGKYCSSCQGSGSPDGCNPTIACSSDADCTGETTSIYCATMEGNFCYCQSADFDLHTENPYANPFIKGIGSGIFDPQDVDQKRSIWCDKASDDISSTMKCSDLPSPY